MSVNVCQRSLPVTGRAEFPLLHVQFDPCFPGAAEVQLIQPVWC